MASWFAIVRIYAAFQTGSQPRKFSERSDAHGFMQTPSTTSAVDRNPFFVLCAIVLLVLALRLISLAFNNSELFFDEAQYWAWAQNLDFGYFSKPPFLAWTIHFFTTLCGSDGEFCVRLAAPVFHTATTLLVYGLGASLFTRRVGFWSAITYLFLPAVSFSSTIISTDVPLLFFWALALLAFTRMVDGAGGLWIVVLGFALGMGLLSKYAMAYFFLCAALYGVVSPAGRAIWKKGSSWLAVLLALAIFSGNIVWNIENQFTTVTHTGDNISWSGVNFHLDKVLEFFGSQFGVFGPILMAVYCLALVRNRFVGGSEAQKLLACFSFPVLGVILFQALMSKAYANWAALTYVGATVYTVEVLLREAAKPWFRASSILHGVVFVVLSLAVTRAGPGQLVLPGDVEPFKRTQGAGEMARIVIQALDQGEYQTVITTDRRTSSLMTYQLRNQPVQVRAWRRSQLPNDYFEQSVAYQDAPGEPALVVYAKRGISDLSDRFERINALGTFPLNSGEIKEISLFGVAGYRPD